MKKRISVLVALALCIVPAAVAQVSGQAFSFSGQPLTQNQIKPLSSLFDLYSDDEGFFASIKRSRQMSALSDGQKKLYAAVYSAQTTKYHVRGLLDNSGQITPLAEPLTNEERNGVYELVRMKPSTYVVSSAILGLGTGLIRQSAWGTGLLFAAVDIANFIYLGVTYVSSLMSVATISTPTTAWLFWVPGVREVILALDMLTGFQLSLNMLSQAERDAFLENFRPNLFASLAIFAVSHTLQALRSYARAKKYNSTLAQVLLLDTGNDDLSLAPVIDPVSGQYGLMASIRLPSPKAR